MNTKKNNNLIFNLNDIEKRIFKDRWVRFAFGPQGFKQSKKLNFGIVNFEKNNISLNHSHHVEEALYVLSGNCKIKIAERTFSIKKDDFVFIPKSTDHKIITDSHPVRILFIFGGEILINH